MRRLVLADVHANLHALDAVLGAASAIGFDTVVCAGDLVGYGAFPNECVERVASLGGVCVAGNHDLVAVGELADDRCIPMARRSLAWTRARLGDDARAWLRALPRRATDGELVVAHGSLEDPERYVASEADALAELRRLPHVEPGARTLVLGHTHRARHLVAGDASFLNPGAVGQSRELRPRARFAILRDTGPSLHAVTYDVRAARDALRRQGLDERGVHLRPGARRAARVVLDRIRARSC